MRGVRRCPPAVDADFGGGRRIAGRCAKRRCLLGGGTNQPHSCRDRTAICGGREPIAAARARWVRAHTGALPAILAGGAAGVRGSGGRMGRQLSSLGFGVGRLAAAAVCCLVLAHCSGPFSSKEYSPRVVEEGEPVPKGGGIYRVGKPYSVNGRTYVPAENPSYRIEGVASWYGRDFHGRLTANGEIYDMHSISAAHTT